MLFVTIKPFLESELISEIVLVLAKEDCDIYRSKISSINSPKPVTIVSGGEKRQESVYNGLLAADKSSELICIHDAVRPFVDRNLINKTFEAIDNHDGVITALPSTDTIKEVIKDQVRATLPREKIWRAQTPQLFYRNPLLEGLELAIKENIDGTDEASLLERIGYQIGYVKGSPFNLKITTKEDWAFAKSIFTFLNND